MNPFVFCSYSYTKECFPQVTANMMAAIGVPDLSSNSERKKKKKKSIKQCKHALVTNSATTCIATLPWIALLALSVCIELISSSTKVTSVKSQKHQWVSDTGIWVLAYVTQSLMFLRLNLIDRTPGIPKSDKNRYASIFSITLAIKSVGRSFGLAYLWQTLSTL